MNAEIKAMLKILGFEDNINKLPKMKEAMKKYYKEALKCHPDKGGSKEKFQKLEEAMRIVGEYINAKSTVDKNDPEENIAKDLFEDIFSKFNTKKENKRCTTVFINNFHDFAWDKALTTYCGEATEKAEGEKHWKDLNYKINGEQTIVTIRKWTTPINDGKSKLNIQSKNINCVKMWVLGVLPVIFNEVLEIAKSVVIDSNQKESERVTRARNTNKTSTKCNECETTVQSFTDLGKHKKMFHAKISSSSIVTTLAKKNIIKKKAINLQVPQPHNCTVCGNNFVSKSDLDDHITGNHTPTIVKTLDKLQLNEIIDNILGEVINRSNKCSYCGKMYRRTHMLKKHVENNHHNISRTSYTEENVIVVPDREENDEKTEEITQKSGKENTVLSIKCSKCEEIFDDKNTLDMHVNINHSQIDQFKQVSNKNQSISEQETQESRAIREIDELKTKLKKQDEVKEKHERDLLLKIKEAENQTKMNEKTYKKNVKQFQGKIKLLEETLKNYVVELDKQVQLKEKFAEEKKTLTNIIKTHIALKDLKVDLKNLLSIEEIRGSDENEVTVSNSENEWEDIDTEDTENHEFVTVTNKKKKKKLLRQRGAKTKPVVNKVKTCTECDEKFTSKSNLDIHVKKHNTQSILECKECKHAFTTEKNLKHHFSTVHRNIAPDHSREEGAKCKHNCDKCENTYETAQELKNPSSSHSNSVPIKCQLCKFITERQVDFLLHMESHNNANKKQHSGGRRVCSWYQRGTCRYGSKCWNIHSEPPQCIFKSNCRAWPQCKYGHYEICENYQECNYQSCNLVHPSKPFLGPSCPQKTPNIFSDMEFPKLKRSRVMHQ